MLHGTSPDESVSARGPIAIRYPSLLKFSKEHDCSRAKKFKETKKSILSEFFLSCACFRREFPGQSPVLSVLREELFFLVDVPFYILGYTIMRSHYNIDTVFFE